jgi:hypothetical protein
MDSTTLAILQAQRSGNIFRMKSQEVRKKNVKRPSRRLAFLVRLHSCSPWHRASVPAQWVLGRSVEDLPVDVDLSAEGGGSTISRIQSVITFSADGHFRLHNRGRRSVVVDGVMVPRNGRQQYVMGGEKERAEEVVGDRSPVLCGTCHRAHARLSHFHFVGWVKSPCWRLAAPFSSSMRTRAL